MGTFDDPLRDGPSFIDGIGSTVANGDFSFETYFDGSGAVTSKVPGLGPSTPLSLGAYQEWFGTSQPTITANISGVVTDVGGSDPAGICVQAFLNGTAIGASATTAANGTYTIPGLAPGSYGVLFVPGCGGGDFATQWYNDTASGTQSAPGTLVAVTVASPVTGINAAMSAGTSISGTVSAAVGGVGLADICVNAFQVGGANSAGSPTTSAAEGSYAVEGLLPSSYYVEFDSGPCGEGGNYAAQWYNDVASGTPNALDTLAVSTLVASPSTSINAEMALGATISGIVTGAVSGSAVEGACVSATSTDSGSDDSTTTSAIGTYSLSGLTADSYRVVVDPTCRGMDTSSFASPQPTSGAVTVTAGEMSIYEVGLILHGSIVDVVTPSTDAPTNANVGGATYSPSATATSSDNVDIALDGTSTGCELIAGVVSFTAVGTCIVDFRDPSGGANEAYHSAVQVQQEFSVAVSSGGGSSGGGGSSAGGGSSGGGSGDSSGGANPTNTPSTPPANQPSVQLPIPRETKYGTNDIALSARDKSVFAALARRLVTGESLKITGFAYRDATLARKRASVVARFMKSLLKVQITVSINTNSRVGKVIVTTHK